MYKYQKSFDQLKNMKNYIDEDDDDFDPKKTTGDFKKTKKIPKFSNDNH